MLAGKVLSSTGSLEEAKGQNATVLVACLFGGLPLIFMALPALVQYFALKSVGSVLASTTMLGALIIG